MHDKLAVIDHLDADTNDAGNRFMICALVPTCNVSIQLMTGRDARNVVCAVGKSIFDRSSRIDVGDLMLEYGSGRHAAGTCQVERYRAAAAKLDLIRRIIQDG